MGRKTAFSNQPNATPSWLLRRVTKGKSMPSKVNDAPFASPLSPQDWLNITFIATRVTSMMGYPPASMAVEIMGTPEMLWADPEHEAEIVVLDFKYDPDHPNSSKPCLHISATMGEISVLALIGLCAVRDALWIIMPSNGEIEDSELSEEDDDTTPS